MKLLSFWRTLPEIWKARLVCIAMIMPLAIIILYNATLSQLFIAFKVIGFIVSLVGAIIGIAFLIATFDDD